VIGGRGGQGVALSGDAGGGKNPPFSRVQFFLPPGVGAAEGCGPRAQTFEAQKAKKLLMGKILNLGPPKKKTDFLLRNPHKKKNHHYQRLSCSKDFFRRHPRGTQGGGWPGGFPQPRKKKKTKKKTPTRQVQKHPRGLLPRPPMGGPGPSRRTGRPRPWRPVRGPSGKKKTRGGDFPRPLQGGDCWPPPRLILVGHTIGLKKPGVWFFYRYGGPWVPTLAVRGGEFFVRRGGRIGGRGNPGTGRLGEQSLRGPAFFQRGGAGGGEKTKGAGTHGPMNSGPTRDPGAAGFSGPRLTQAVWGSGAKTLWAGLGVGHKKGGPGGPGRRGGGGGRGARGCAQGPGLLKNPPL